MDLTRYSDEQKAGQRLMFGFNGTRLDSELRFLIGTLKAGGIILFAYNISTPAQLAELCASAQEYAAACGQPPLFIAIDQEGGQVARLKEPFTQFTGNPTMGSLEDAIHFARVTAGELTSVGINMNMAPVMDIAPLDCNSVMAGRAFGPDPLWVSDLGVKVIENLQQNRIMSVAKHFPGIGRTVLDSHLDLPALDIDPETLKATDLVPFQAAIDCGVAAVMLSHVIYKQIDPDLPASLSEKIAGKLLRREMDFDRLVMTDDLDMGAIANHYDIKTVIRQILAADIDIPLICHRSPLMETAFETILKAYRDSPELKAKTDESCARILRLKERYLA